jgi:two-component system, OmpR family, sensor histidine kinase MprB
MSFRRRVVLLAAGAVAAAIVIASVVVYVVTRNELQGQLDSSLRAKITPGQSSVHIHVSGTRSQLIKLAKEGKLPVPVPSAFGLSSGASRSSGASGPNGASASNVRASGEAVAPADGPQALAVAIQGSSKGSGVVHAESSAAHAGSSGAGHETMTIEAQTATSPAPAPKESHLQTASVVGRPSLVLPTTELGGATGYVQLLLSNGEVIHTPSEGSGLAVTAATRAVAAGRRDAFFSDATVSGTPVRVLTERAGEDGVWQVALPVGDIDSTLTHLELVLALVSLGGIALAAALGLLVSRAALVPVRRLTGAAERVARTQDLTHRIAPGVQDELGRLAQSFNTMLAALERSRLAQRQLVSDASHELRTPLTSVQANLDALALGEERMPASERARVVAATQAQLRELTVLVGDLVDLSKTEVDEVEVEDVRLDLAAAGAIERARLHGVGGHSCTFVLDAEPCLVRAAPARLDRAIANLLDNACKWNPSPPSAGRAGDPIEVRVRDGRLQVRDHGPGIAAEDLPRVFDRFYRSSSARGLPGSGLGLAIVRQVAEMYGGSVHAANDPDGGARLTLELSPLQMTAAELAAAESGVPPVTDGR